MIVQDNFLKKIRSAFDLNIYEAKIWTALLSRGMATAGELSDISNVPRSRSYDILESLEKKGFVMLKVGKPIKYIAIQPEEVVKRVKQTVKNSSDQKLKHLSEVKEDKLFKDLELLFKQGITHVDASSLAGAIKGRDNIYAHIDFLLQDAKKTVTIMTTPDGLIRKFDKLKFRFKKLKDKGVKLRIATLPSETVSKRVNEIKQLAELRSVSNIKARFVIVDKSDILFITSDDKEVHESYDTAIWVKSPFFAQALETMFDLAWTSQKK